MLFVEFGSSFGGSFLDSMLPAMAQGILIELYLTMGFTRGHGIDRALTAEEAESLVPVLEATIRALDYWEPRTEEDCP